MSDEMSPEEFREYLRLFEEMTGQNTPMPQGFVELFEGMGVGGWVLLAAGILLVVFWVYTLRQGRRCGTMLYLGACGMPLWIGGIAGAVHILPILMRYEAIKTEGTWLDLNMTGLAMGLTPMAVGLRMTLAFSLLACAALLRIRPPLDPPG